MPRQHQGIPTYRVRVSNGKRYGYVNLEGRQVSLGPDGSEAAKRRYAELVAAWANPDVRPIGEAPDSHGSSDLVVAELAERFLEHTRARIKHGEISGKALWLTTSTIDALCHEHGMLLVAQFKGRSLKQIQQRLLKTACNTRRGRFRDATEPPCLSRNEVNRRINQIRRIFKWGVSEEFVPETTLTSLASVDGLRRGRGRETPGRAHVFKSTTQLKTWPRF